MVSRFRNKKNFLEANNIKVRVLKQHFTSDQYQVEEYINSKGIVKHTWVHRTELFIGNTANLESTDIYARGTNITEFNVQDYNKLLTNFEQHIAEKWCNSRKLKHKLLGEIQDDKDYFSQFDSNQIKEGKSNSSKYHGERVFEILDSLFSHFCADAFSIQYDHDSNNINRVLRYSAFKNFNEHLGYLQHWFRNRRKDNKGKNFYKIHELQNPSLKHHCEQCIFTEYCKHECCLKLFYFTCQQKKYICI